MMDNKMTSKQKSVILCMLTGWLKPASNGAWQFNHDSDQNSITLLNYE